MPINPIAPMSAVERERMSAIGSEKVEFSDMATHNPLANPELVLGKRVEKFIQTHCKKNHVGFCNRCFRTEMLKRQRRIIADEQVNELTHNKRTQPIPNVNELAKDEDLLGFVIDKPSRIVKGRDVPEKILVATSTGNFKTKGVKTVYFAEFKCAKCGAGLSDEVNLAIAEELSKKHGVLLEAEAL